MLGWHEFKKWILYSLRQCKLSYVIVLSNSINIGLVSNNRYDVWFIRCLHSTVCVCLDCVILTFSSPCPLAFPQYVEMQRGFLHTIQQLQLELNELRDRTGAPKDGSQTAQESSAESTLGQNKGNNMAANGSGTTDSSQSVKSNGVPDCSTKVWTYGCFLL